MTSEYLYKDTDFAYIDAMLARIASEAYANKFVVTYVETFDDWVSPSVQIVTVHTRREDLGLTHHQTFRSNGNYVSNNPTKSMRTLVRDRHRQLVLKMGRRLNKTKPDADGLYRRSTHDD